LEEMNDHATQASIALHTTDRPHACGRLVSAGACRIDACGFGY